MKELDVKITRLSAVKVITFYGYGEQPEALAWQSLIKWVKESGLTLSTDKNKIYGYNNPCPSAGSSKYGYEYIITVDPEFKPLDLVKISEFPGGLYATSEIQVTSGEEIPQNWKALNIWCEKSKYSFAQHHWLEEHTLEGVPFRLFLPVTE